VVPESAAELPEGRADGGDDDGASHGSSVPTGFPASFDLTRRRAYSERPMTSATRTWWSWRRERGGSLRRD
jgi:hypothetical protein